MSKLNKNVRIWVCMMTTFAYNTLFLLFIYVYDVVQITRNPFKNPDARTSKVIKLSYFLSFLLSTLALSKNPIAELIDIYLYPAVLLALECFLLAVLVFLTWRLACCCKCSGRD